MVNQKTRKQPPKEALKLVKPSFVLVNTRRILWIVIPAIGLVSKDLLGSMVELLDRVLKTAFL